MSGNALIYRKMIVCIQKRESARFYEHFPFFTRINDVILFLKMVLQIRNL